MSNFDFSNLSNCANCAKGTREADGKEHKHTLFKIENKNSAEDVEDISFDEVLNYITIGKIDSRITNNPKKIKLDNVHESKSLFFNTNCHSIFSEPSIHSGFTNIICEDKIDIKILFHPKKNEKRTNTCGSNYYFPKLFINNEHHSYLETGQTCDININKLLFYFENNSVFLQEIHILEDEIQSIPDSKYFLLNRDEPSNLDYTHNNFDSKNKIRDFNPNISHCQYCEISISFFTRLYGQIAISILIENSTMKINIELSKQQLFDQILLKQSEIVDRLTEAGLSVLSLDFTCRGDGPDGAETDIHDDDHDTETFEQYPIGKVYFDEKWRDVLSVIRNSLDT